MPTGSTPATPATSTWPSTPASPSCGAGDPVHPDWHPAAAAAVAEAAGLTTKDGLAAAPVRRKLATALLIINLAANIPTTVLVDLLGISIDAANRWAKHASSD
jgi:hypothetical protein